MFNFTDWLQKTGRKSKLKNKPPVTIPALTMKEFLEGRKNSEAYSVFMERFVPCVTMKTSWDRRLATADPDCTKNMKSLCTVSDEAFALLLLENSYDRWLDIFTTNKGAVMQQRGVRQRGFQSDTPTLYTSGGIKYDKADVTKAVKGWSDMGIERFNCLFEQVKQDRMANPNFERMWLVEIRRAQAENGPAPKKPKRQQTQARSELFESDEESNIATTAHEGPVDESDNDGD